MRSQDTTDSRPIPFPAWMVKEIALDLNEKERLVTNLEILFLELATHKTLTQNLELTLDQKDLQIHHLQSIQKSLTLQNQLPQPHHVAQSKFQKILSSLALLSLGYLLGSLAQ